MKGQTLTPSRTLYPGFTLSTGSATAPYSEHMEMNKRDLDADFNVGVAMLAIIVATVAVIASCYAYFF